MSHEKTKRSFKSIMSAASIESHDDPPMREPNLSRDITAIALFAITLIVTVSVVTRSAADPLDTPVWPISNFYQPDAVVYPSNPSITNACGYWGAMIASILLDSIGLATALVIAATGGTATALLTRGKMNAPVLRSFGGTIVVLAAATAAGLLPTKFDGMPVVGNGGYLGAMSSTWLLEHFAPAGAWILTLTTLTIGLLLTTDYALLYAGRAIMSQGARATGSVRRAGKFIPIAGRTRQPFTDLEQPITIDGDQSELSDEEGDEGELEVEVQERHEPTIKFNRSKKKGAAAIGAAAAAGLAAAATALGASQSEQDEEYDEEDEEYWDEEEDEEETEVAESPTRELEIEDEEVTLRQDEPHPVSHPKVRAPKPKTKKDPRQEFYDSIHVNAPEGSEDYQLPSLATAAAER